MASELSAADEHYLRRAIALANSAVERGNHPFGALIVARPRENMGGDPVVIVEAENSVHTGHDPTGHAETNAIRALGKVLHEQRDSISTATHTIELFTSTEPCVMCSGAIYWSFSVERVVYACSEVGLGKYAGEDFLCPTRETFARGARKIVVEGPFLQKEAEAPHALYWPKLFGTAATA
jgi:tRNA(Arg) A34 adenosine deaminase TadA